jgi:hypothetical protein
MDRAFVESCRILGESAVAIAPFIGLLVLLLIIGLVFLRVYRQIIKSNHFDDNVDPQAQSVITILEAELKTAEAENKRKDKIIEDFTIANQKIIEISSRAGIV